MYVYVTLAFLLFQALVYPYKMSADAYHFASTPPGKKAKAVCAQ